MFSNRARHGPFLNLQEGIYASVASAIHLRTFAGSVSPGTGDGDGLGLWQEGVGVGVRMGSVELGSVELSVDLSVELGSAETTLQGGVFRMCTFLV